MTPARAVSLLQLATGTLLLRRPALGLTLLSYPRDTLSARIVLRVLGGRHLLQGTAELTGRRSVLLSGAAVDVLHASTALLYAHLSDSGRRAGRRNAALALGFAAAELVAARRAASHGPGRAGRSGVVPRSRPAHPPATYSPVGAELGTDLRADLSADLSADVGADVEGAAPEPIARVSSPRSRAWPMPTDTGQHVLVEYPDGGCLVRLRGGAMDGATVCLPDGQTSYQITDTEHGPLHYLPPGHGEQHDPDGLPVLTLTEAEPEPDQGGESACWLPLVCEGCGAIMHDVDQPGCSRCRRGP